MISWPAFADQRPDQALAGRQLLYQYGVGLAFLSTVRADGGPRLHPICPVVTEHGLFALLIPSPKLTDLQRDGRYALHSYAAPENEDAFYLTGEASFPDSMDLRKAIEDAFRAERSDQGAATWDLSTQTLVEFDVDVCLLTRTTGHGDPAPRHTIWKA